MKVLTILFHISPNPSKCTCFYTPPVIYWNGKRLRKNVCTTHTIYEEQSSDETLIKYRSGSGNLQKSYQCYCSFQNILVLSKDKTK